MKILRTLWNDQAGFVVSTELMLVATILVIGMIVGMTTLRNDVVAELADVAGAIGDLSQDYNYSAVQGHSAFTNGSTYADQQDFCSSNDDRTGLPDQCVDVNVVQLNNAE